MSETSGTQHPDTGDLYPQNHPDHLFTNDEIAEILRFAKEHGIHGVAEGKLIAYIRDVRAAHLKRAKAQETPHSEQEKGVKTVNSEQ
ncbi:MAG TPA: hypothetical protein V6C85_36690 [Allocoleopsis sp.]